MIEKRLSKNKLREIAKRVKSRLIEELHSREGALDQEILQTYRSINKKIKSYDIPFQNSLICAKIKTLAELSQKTDDQLLEAPGIGKVKLFELKHAIEEALAKVLPEKWKLICRWTREEMIQKTMCKVQIISQTKYFSYVEKVYKQEEAFIDDPRFQQIVEELKQIGIDIYAIIREEIQKEIKPKHEISTNVKKIKNSDIKRKNKAESVVESDGLKTVEEHEENDEFELLLDEELLTTIEGLRGLYEQLNALDVEEQEKIRQIKLELVKIGPTYQEKLDEIIQKIEEYKKMNEQSTRFQIFYELKEDAEKALEEFGDTQDEKEKEELRKELKAKLKVSEGERSRIERAKKAVIEKMNEYYRDSE